MENACKSPDYWRYAFASMIKEIKPLYEKYGGRFPHYPYRWTLRDQESQFKVEEDAGIYYLGNYGFHSGGNRYSFIHFRDAILRNGFPSWEPIWSNKFFLNWYMCPGFLEVGSLPNGQAVYDEIMRQTKEMDDVHLIIRQREYNWIIWNSPELDSSLRQPMVNIDDIKVNSYSENLRERFDALNTYIRSIPRSTYSSENGWKNTAYGNFSDDKNAFIGSNPYEGQALEDAFTKIGSDLELIEERARQASLDASWNKLMSIVVPIDKIILGIAIVTGVGIATSFLAPIISGAAGATGTGAAAVETGVVGGASSGAAAGLKNEIVGDHNNAFDPSAPSEFTNPIPDAPSVDTNAGISDALKNSFGKVTPGQVIGFIGNLGNSGGGGSSAPTAPTAAGTAGKIKKAIESNSVPSGAALALLGIYFFAKRKI